MTTEKYTVDTVITGENGVASFDAAAGLCRLPPQARNESIELFNYLMGKLEYAYMVAYFCSLPCNEKSFDLISTRLKTLVQRLDINTLRAQISEIGKECRDISREREESLSRQICDARSTIGGLMREFDELKQKTCAVGRIREESWPDSGQDPIFDARLEAAN